MKKLCIAIGFGFCPILLCAQQIPKDSLSIENLEEVLITSTRVAAGSPITHSNLSAEEIKERNLGQDIPILLKYLPSVTTSSDAGAGVGYTYLRVRGSDGSRVNVTLNGIPFNDAESQGTFFVNLPDLSSSAQSIQLQRGVGTSTNGAGAFGASLAILTDGVVRRPAATFANSYGSSNTQKYTLKYNTGLLKNRFAFSGRLSSIRSDGYIDRAASDLKSYFLQAAFVGGKTLVKALAFGGREETYQAYFGIGAGALATNRTFNPAGLYTDEEGNVQFYDNEVDNYAQDHYQLLVNHRFNNHWSTNVSLNYTYGRGYFEQYREDEPFETYGFTPITVSGETINMTDLVRRRWLDNNFYALNAHANYKDETVSVTGGMFYGLYKGDHFGEVIWAQFTGGSEIRDRYYFGTGTKKEFTVFSKATFKLNKKWTVFADLQGRFINYRTGGATSDLAALDVRQNYSFFNPKAGASFMLNAENQFYLSYGRANREPRRSDFEQGIFTPETLDDVELGWRTSTKKVAVSSNLFYMHYTNQLVLTGAIDDVGAPVRATSGKSYRLGIEVEADIELTEKLKLLPNIALSTNKNRGFVTSRHGQLVNLGTTNLSYSPQLIAANSLEFRPNERLQLALLSKYVGEQFMGNIDSGASKLDSYFLNDLNINYTLTSIPYFERVRFTALVNNIFNVEYVPNGYFFTFDDDFSNPGVITTVAAAGYYPAAKINYLLGVALRF